MARRLDACTTLDRRHHVRLATLVACLCCATLALLAQPARAVHRGFDAPIAEYPFMVSLRLTERPDAHRCGGTLIEPDIVLTAAHCLMRVPERGLVAVVGADVADWPRAPRVATLGHRFPSTFDLRPDNRDDIAVVRLATPQKTPGVRLATSGPGVGSPVVASGWGCTSAPPTCQARPTTLQATNQIVIRDAACGTDVFWLPPFNARTTICTRGAKPRSTVNRGDSGGPLLVRTPSGAFRQLGVTSLGADSTTKLYAGFTSIPVARKWIAEAIRSLRG